MGNIRIGIVGLGEHALRAHVKHLIEDPRVCVVIGFDPSPTARLAFTSMVPSALATDNLQSLWETPLDAVFICSPDRFHAEQLEEAIARQRHVFCEKPMVVLREDLKILNHAVLSSQMHNKVLATCHPRRLDPPFEWIKAQIDSGALAASIGTLRYFEFNFWYPKITDAPEDAWKKQRSLLSDHVGHEIDALSFFFPHLEDFEAKRLQDSYWLYEVQGRARTLALDQQPINFRFLGVRDSEGSSYDEMVTIQGTRGAWTANLSKGVVLKSPSGTLEPMPIIDYDVRFKAVNLNFVDAILGIAPNYLAPSDLLRNNTLSVQLDQGGNGAWSHSMKKQILSYAK